MTDSVLSYWSDYFSPDHRAQFADHSTGLIASRLYSLLGELGPVAYFDNAERPSGINAKLFVGHFWSFESMCRANEFDKKVAVYVLSDPSAARDQLDEAATHPILAAMPDARSSQDEVAVLVGPEGGWSPAEREHLLAAGWQAVSLGPRTLRVESAAVAGAALLLLSASFPRSEGEGASPSPPASVG